MAGGGRADALRASALRSHRGGFALVVVFLVVAAGVAGVGRLYYDGEQASIVAQKGSELAAIRNLKIEQIGQWREHRLQDGRIAAKDPTVADEIESWLSRSPASDDAEARLAGWIAAMVAERGFVDGIVISADGSRWVTDGSGRGPDRAARAEAERALGSSDATITDLFLDPDTREPRLDVVAPLSGGTGTPVAVLVLRCDPAIELYPLIQAWPTPSATSETQLVRREGDSILYLNDLRFSKGAALTLRRPLEAQSTLLASRAVQGVTSVVEGVDYRGAPTFGALGRVPGSTWYVVAKVDKDEAFAGVFATQRTTLVGVALVVVGAGLGIGMAWRQRAAAFYRSGLETERAARELAQRYDLLSRYANDVVMVVDASATIIQANDRVQAVYGYSPDELVGVPLQRLYPPRSVGEAIGDVESLRSTGVLAAERTHVREDGSHVEVEIGARAVDIGEDAQYLLVIRDITERKAADEVLRETRDYLEKLIDYSNVPMIVWDPDLAITRFNPAFERMTGRSSDEVLGQHLSVLFPADSREESLEQIRRAVDGESWESVEIPILRADGQVRVALWNSATVYAPDGRTVQAVIAQGQDITERKAADEALRARTEELAKSNAELEKFAYVASHDLQEPLRMVASYTQLLAKRYAGRLDSDADEFIGFAVDGATRMQTLINELLTYSRVGTRGKPFQTVDLEGVLGSVLKGLEPAIAQAGAVVLREPMPTIVCDPVQLGQVFQNLIANALKFHGAATPEVRIEAERGEGFWTFRVRDNGMGIEEQYFERIFVIFQRLESRAEYPGTGMGLAICKRIVERHGGRLWVESAADAGSTFVFEIPDMREGEQHG